MMRLCPKCGDFYADELLAFCPADGSPLINVNPEGDKWREGSRVIEGKQRRIRKQQRNARWLWVLAIAGMMLMAAVLMSRSITVVTTTSVPPLPLPDPSPSPYSSPSTSPLPSPLASSSPTPSPSSSPSPSPSPSPPRLYKISGRVTAENQPVRGVEIMLEGTNTATATTNADGYYRFSDLPADGNYTINATGRLKFDPPSRSFNKLRRDETADFKVQAEVFKISGQVMTPAGPRGGIKISLGGAMATSTTTNGDGYYAFTDLMASRNYIVTPRGDLQFDPPSRSFDKLRRDETANFQSAAPPPPKCSEADEASALQDLKAFEPGWRHHIEGERAKILEENVPKHIGAEATLTDIEFQYSFPAPCKAAVVTARYEWQIQTFLPGASVSTRRVAGRRIFRCMKLRGRWGCL